MAYMDLNLTYDAAVDAIRRIKEKNQLLQDSATQLQSKLAQINSAWDSTGKDKMAVCSNLEEQIKRIRSLNGSLATVGVMILSYLDTIKNVSDNTM